MFDMFDFKTVFYIYLPSGELRFVRFDNSQYVYTRIIHICGINKLNINGNIKNMIETDELIALRCFYSLPFSFLHLHVCVILKSYCYYKN